MKNEAKLLNGCRFLLPFVLSNVQKKSKMAKKKEKQQRSRKKANEMAKQIVLVGECVGHIATD